MQATTKDLRLRTRELLVAAARGEEVVITYRGKRCAKLVLLGEKSISRPSGERRTPAFGLWRDREADSVDQEVRKLRQPRQSEGTLVEFLRNSPLAGADLDLERS